MRTNCEIADSIMMFLFIFEVKIDNMYVDRTNNVQIIALRYLLHRDKKIKI